MNITSNIPKFSAHIASSPTTQMPSAKMLPVLPMLLLGLLSLLGPAPAAAEPTMSPTSVGFVPDKLECAAVCAGGRLSGDGCDGEHERINCGWWISGTVTYTVGNQKLGRVPGWTGVAHKDKKTTV